MFALKECADIQDEVRGSGWTRRDRRMTLMRPERGWIIVAINFFFLFVRLFSLAGERTRGLFCFVFGTDLDGTYPTSRPINLFLNKFRVTIRRITSFVTTPLKNRGILYIIIDYFLSICVELFVLNNWVTIDCLLS